MQDKNRSLRRPEVLLKGAGMVGSFCSLELVQQQNLHLFRHERSHVCSLNTKRAAT
jgi:hypothetical protein